MTRPSAEKQPCRRSAFSLFAPCLIFAFTPVVATSFEADPSLLRAIEGDHRPESDTRRDIYRHPLQTLTFFGLHADAHVLELSPGRGWYTAILAPVLKERGSFTVASFGADHPSDYLAGIHRDFIASLEAAPDIYERVHVIKFDTPLSAVADESMDMVLTFRNTHNWIRAGTAADVYRSIARVLRPGGILGLVQHRDEAGRNYRGGEEGYTGYISEDQVIALATQAGLTLAERSEVNANPKDTRSHPEGVWTLPPTLRLGEKDRDRYTAIGESDRMTLRFVKP